MKIRCSHESSYRSRLAIATVFSFYPLIISLHSSYIHSPAGAAGLFQVHTFKIHVKLKRRNIAKSIREKQTFLWCFTCKRKRFNRSTSHFFLIFFFLSFFVFILYEFHIFPQFLCSFFGFFFIFCFFSCFLYFKNILSCLLFLNFTLLYSSCFSGHFIAFWTLAFRVTFCSLL